MLKEQKNNVFVLGLVAILGILSVTPMAKADLDIDLLGISCCKQFRDGEPQGSYPWSLDILLSVVDPGALHHIDITKPGDSDPFVTLYEEATPAGWWGCSLDDDYYSLSALRAVYQEGTYKFDFRDIGDGLIRSLNIDYTALPGEPTEPVEFIYPSMDSQTGISVNPTFTWSVSPDAGDALMTVIDNDETVYFDAPVSISSTSCTPGPLLDYHDYELDVFVVNIKDWTGGPEFSTMTDNTGDTFSYAHTIEYLNEAYFTTGPEPDVSATLDIVADTITQKTKWITCHLRLPDHDIADVDLDSIQLGGDISAVRASVREKQQMLVVKFSVSELNLAPRPEPYSLTVSGELIGGGTTFAGSDDIIVIQKGGKKN